LNGAVRPLFEVNAGLSKSYNERGLSKINPIF